LLWEFLPDIYLGSYFTYPEPVNILAQGNAGILTDAEVNQKLESLGAYNNAKDYSRLFLRPAVTQTYNVDLSGGMIMHSIISLLIMLGVLLTDQKR
jgi:hypothetical protein